MDYFKQLNAFYSQLEYNPVSANAISLWQALMHIANKTRWLEYFTVANKTLELKSSLEISSLQRARNELIQKDLLVYIKGTGRSVHATYNLPVLYEQESEQVNDQPIHNEQVSAQVGEQIPAQVSEHSSKHKTKNVKHKTKDVKPIAPATPEKPDRFTAFWSAYPKKKNKGDAEKAWKAIKPDDALLNAMLSSIEVQKKSHAWIKDGGQYIPYPASWLRAKGWEDEIGGQVNAKPEPRNKSRFVNYKQRDNDYDELERMEREYLNEIITEVQMGVGHTEA